MNEQLTVGAVIEDAYISAGIVNLKSREVDSQSLRRKRVDPSGKADEIFNAWASIISDVLSKMP